MCVLRGQSLVILDWLDSVLPGQTMSLECLTWNAPDDGGYASPGQWLPLSQSAPAASHAPVRPQGHARNRPQWYRPCWIP